MKRRDRDLKTRAQLAHENKLLLEEVRDLRRRTFNLADALAEIKANQSASIPRNLGFVGRVQESQSCHGVEIVAKIVVRQDHFFASSETTFAGLGDWIARELQKNAEKVVRPCGTWEFKG